MEIESGAKEPVKVGVIGCGRIGIVHLGAINKAPGVSCVVVSNPTVSKAENGKCTSYEPSISVNDQELKDKSHSLLYRSG